MLTKVIDSKKGLAILFIALLCAMTNSFGQDTYRDNFSSTSYANNNGTQNFAGNWDETGDDNSPSSGRIEIVGNELEFNNIDSRTIFRDLDLSGASSVTLDLDYDANSRGNESLRVQLWNDNTSSYETVSTINSTNTGSVSHTLTADQISANSSIRFVGGDSNWGGSETIYIDNVLFTATFSPTITINDITFDEAVGNAVFTVTHTGANASGAFTVNYQTVNGTATSGSDYTFSSGTLNFNGTSGDTETITVAITDDGSLESTEAFTIQFTGSSDGTVNYSDTAAGNITDNDGLIITDGVTENTCSGTFLDSGGVSSTYTNNEDITYTICPDVGGSFVRVNFTSFDVENGYDFLYVYEGTTTGGTLIGQYHNGNVPGTITSTDGSGCLTFRFTSDFSVTNNGWEATVSCYVPGPTMTISDVSVDEDAGNAVFTVTHTGASASGAFTVNYQTADGTATAGSDYTSSTGTLNFNGTVGDTEITTVPITDDAVIEGDETFTVQFTASSDGTVDYSDTATGTINAQISSDVPLTLFEEFHGNVDYVVTGNTLRTADNGTDPCAVTNTTSANLIAPIPGTGTIRKAYLYWAHSSSTMDADVTFEGQAVTADLAYNAYSATYWSYLSDVTTIVNGVANPSTNTYDFADLTIDNTSSCGSQGVLGGWALIVFYDDPTLPASSINLYQGFQRLRNASDSFTLDSFYAIAGSGAKATFLSWEGDSTLSGASETLSITNQSGTTHTLSGDGGQTGNNAYNSTIYDDTQGPAYNDATTYGLDLDTYGISSYISPGDSQVTANVSVASDAVFFNAVLIRVQSNLVTGTVFEDVNYPGGAGRDMATASGVGVNNASLELYDASNTYVETVTSDSSGDYTFGGMADGNYTIRVVNSSVRSSRGGGIACTSCLPVQTYRNYNTSGSFVDVTNEVGGADPSAADAVAGTLTGAQTRSAITIASGGIVGLDFGFNFNTIVNTNEDDQGSLEQFIINSNNLDETGLDIGSNSIFDPAAGDDTSIFMIPSSADPLGRTTDSNYGSGYFDITISNGNPLTAITGDNTRIDGRTQTAYSGNTNSGTVGSGGATVGTSANTLPNYSRPEIQVHRDQGDVLDLQANATIRNLAIYANNNAAIQVNSGAGSILSSLIGVNAAGTNAGNVDYGVEILGGGIQIDGNYIATNTDAGLLINGGTSSVIQNNHITNNGDQPCDDNIEILSGSGITIQRNLIENSAAGGVDASAYAGGLILSENAITTAGQNGGNCAGNIENMGVLLAGNNSQLSNNQIYSNGGAGVVVVGGTGNLISQNSIYANGTSTAALGIDLDPTANVGDGVNINDSGDGDSGPNNLLNFPIIESVYLSGSNLVVKGWSRPGTTLEFFITDISEGTATTGDNQLGQSTDYGEGQTFLGSAIEGSGSDSDSSTSAYSDADGNTDNTNAFQFSIPLSIVPSGGDLITATAMLGNSTSEFSPISALLIPTVITNRGITYRVNRD
ncbi:right-handed parallel beta-helix repeat-containing protein [Muricauda sp. 2012CJ35-5]|uniref:Right-handed parallel beta-helix repeat-containing protein n=1 Tax=Flagellimonas spongiicola TaxID=2942208 RepID=A0ABT0PX31_9FLAO|nr:Calx-beta domain-containing protein [Allomuricauda spongiicola]MCL6275287.1 right-handed parallel beta-helix repeat-containing protein [Allomuricauda spongiicola]